MGYWENTAYINCDSVDNVSRSIIKLFEAEGMVYVGLQKERKRKAYEAMQYGNGNNNNTWAVAVFPGHENWTVVKTAPLELLGERKKNHDRARLVELCEILSHDGLLYNIFDSGPEILFEVSRTGEYILSGWSYDGAEDYHDEKLNFLRYDVEFSLLDLNYIFDNADTSDDRAGALSDILGGESSKYCDNSTSVDVLISRKKLPIESGRVLYFEYSGDDRKEWEPVFQSKK